MRDFAKSVLTRLSPQADAQSIIAQLVHEERQLYPFELKNFAAGRQFERAEPEFQRAILMAMLAWHEAHPSVYPGILQPKAARELWKMLEAFDHMLRHKMPLAEADVIALLEWSGRQIAPGGYYKAAPRMIKIVSDYVKDNAPSDRLKAAIAELIQAVRGMHMSTEGPRWIQQLKVLMGDTRVELPLTPGDVWADSAVEEIRALEDARQAAWTELLSHCLRAAGAAPGQRWRKTAQQYMDAIGTSDFQASLLRWFPLVDKPRAEPIHPYDQRETPLPVNGHILRGLVWLCAVPDNPEMARALTALAISAYRKIPTSGPRAAKVGNACFWALGNMPGPEGAAQLSILKSRIRTASAQKAIANALASVAGREGMSEDDLEEMLVPAYGMQQVGLRRDEYGDLASEVRISGSDPEQRWLTRDGKVLASAPRAIKEKYAGELRASTQAIKDIRKMLPAQRDRIDQQYLKRRKWDLSTWQSRYLDHPLVGTIARRLIWKFSRGDRTASGILLGGKIVGRDGLALDWLDGSTLVELWHPLQAEVEAVLEWRQLLAEHEIRQPFKQAHREIYLLTDAERRTRTYSNRYAAHILRQHQFNSLCAARGWKNSLRLMVDDEYPPATKLLPEWGLRAEYWIEGIGDQFGTDTNEAGTFLYLTTDQVRLYSMQASQNRAHAGGGGYATVRRSAGDRVEPLPLEEIPALVFSEIMRDVDLFVGVASVGNDPTWLDGGAEARYRDYWHGFSFGELGETAKTRRAALEVLIPRLKIAERCRLTDKFLVVRGDIRTYKIHLGSGNILMEPNDQYLCIVPSRGTSGFGQERVFVPFEGDQTLAVILSKAFLLAEDRKISDPSITRQLNG